EAGVLGARPDARDEPELLDAVEPAKFRRVDQGEVVPGKRDAVVEGIADLTVGLHRQPGPPRRDLAVLFDCAGSGPGGHRAYPFGAGGGAPAPLTIVEASVPRASSDGAPSTASAGGACRIVGALVR